jgi:hypothetical protein
MSNTPPRFRYVVGNVLHPDFKRRKRNLSEAAANPQGQDLRVTAGTAPDSSVVHTLPESLEARGFKVERKAS